MYGRQLIRTTAKRKIPFCKLFFLLFGILCCAVFASAVLLHLQWKRIQIHKGLIMDNFEAPTELLQEEDTLIFLDDTDYKFAHKQTLFPNAKLFKKPSTTKNKTFSQNATISQSRYTSAIEHDPTIDENVVPQSFKFVTSQKADSNERQSDCSAPIQNLVFIRTHRTGSHTISNIFYRYGDYNNVFFALPNLPTFQYYWPLRFHHSYVQKDLVLENSPNFVINVARNNKHNLNSVTATDTFHIAIVRDPVQHFQSIYEYLDFSFYMRLISNETNLFSEFLKDPKKNLEHVLNATNLFDPVFHLLKNPLLFDLGYETADYNNTLDLDFVIQALEEQLDFVIVAEYWDESLVVLQRLLCWQLSDMAYIKQRERIHRDEISEGDEQHILTWNKEDSRLYQHFNTTLWKMIGQQDDTFWQDVKELKKLSLNIKHDCTQDDTTKSTHQSNAANGMRKLVENVTTWHLKSRHDNHADTKNISEMEKIDRMNNISRSGEHSKGGNEEENENDKFEYKHKLRVNVNPDLKYLCEKLLLEEKDYVDFLKRKQKQMIHEARQLNFTHKYYSNSTDNHFLYLKFIPKNKTSASVNTTESPDAGEEKEEIQEIILGA